MSVRQRFVGALIRVLFKAACGSNGSSLTGHRDQFPNVAGNYSGTITIMYPQLQYHTIKCSATTSVTQNGDCVSIAPLQFSGSECTPVPSLPVGDMTIDRNGSLGQGTGSVAVACGLYNYESSGGFFGRSLQGSYIYTSQTCYNMNVTINLTR